MTDELRDRLKMMAVSQSRMDVWDSLDGPTVSPIEVLELISDVLKWRAAADKNLNEAANLQAELWQWKDGIRVDKCNRCGGPPPLMLFQYHNHAGSDIGFAFCKKCYAPIVRGDYDEQKKLAAEKKEADRAKFMNDFRETQTPAVKIVEAGVDPEHQRVSCDDCGHVFQNAEECVPTCSHTEYLSLCRQCYGKRGNGVR